MTLFRRHRVTRAATILLLDYFEQRIADGHVRIQTADDRIIEAYLWRTAGRFDLAAEAQQDRSPQS